jgi:hypothetical protein
MTVQGLDDNIIIQVCLIVDDVERYAKNYSEVFGLEMPKSITSLPDTN